jgi:hypothetical protein
MRNQLKRKEETFEIYGSIFLREVNNRGYQLIERKNMTQATDTDIKEIRDLLLGLDKKLDIHIATNDERLKSIDAQLIDIKLQQRSQDNRLWTFIATLFVVAIGTIAKLTFFSGGN